MKRKNIILSLLILCIMVFSINIKTSAQETEVPEGYTGIYTIADLWGIRNDTAGKYILMNDIDLTEATKKGGDWDTGMGWVPIPTFSGVLDGNGYRIIGMNIYGNSSSAIGFISNLNGGTIQNLGLKDVSIDVYAHNVGSIAGESKGYNVHSYIINCYCSGKVRNNTTESKYKICDTSGVLGYNNGWARISNCFNLTDIDSHSYFSNNYPENINAGICVAGSSNVVNNCYSCGKIENADYNYGITDSPANNCYYLSGSVNENKVYSGISALTSVQMKYPQSFTGFDFKNTWEIDEYCNYPYPQLKNNRYIRVERIELISAPSKLTYKQGDALNLNGATIKLYYDDGYDTTIVPTKDMVADYDMNAIGTQTISICRGDKKVTFDIEVEGIEASSIKLNQTQIDIQKSKTQQLTATILPDNTSDKTIVWSSKDPSIATVSDNGLVTAKNAGETIITATTTNGLKAQCAVNVKVPSVRLFLDKEQIELMKGDTEELNATLSPLDSTDGISWSSDNARIASVVDGTVIGKQAGKTIVRAKTDSGIEKSCTVVVKQSITEFKVAGVQDKQYTGGQIKQDLEVYNENSVLKEGVDYTISYKNNVNVGVATVSIYGKNYYIDSQTFTFNIDKNTIANTSVKLAYSNCTYDGSPKCPNVSVQINGQKLISGRDYDYSYVSNNAPGTAFVVITGKGNFAGTKQVAYTISMPGSSLKKASALKKKKVLVTCSPVKGASGYQIQYSLKKNFAGAKIKTTTKTSQKISGLKKGKKYYFRVRAVVKANGNVYYSGWSNKKSVKVKK